MPRFAALGAALFILASCSPKRRTVQGVYVPQATAPVPSEEYPLQIVRTAATDASPYGAEPKRNHAFYDLDLSERSRSEGLRSAIAKTRFGWFIVTPRGTVLGPLVVPADATWVGFVDADDKVALQTKTGELWVAATADDAVIGKFAPRNKRAPKILDASGPWVIATDRKTLMWSPDGGSTFRVTALPRKDLIDLGWVRSDGAAVVAAIRGEGESQRIAGYIWSRKGGFTESRFDASSLMRAGDRISTGSACPGHALSIDGKTWVQADGDAARLTDVLAVSNHVRLTPPYARPVAPPLTSATPACTPGGIVGGARMTCAGSMCLLLEERRAAAVFNVGLFANGRCDAKGVEKRTTTPAPGVTRTIDVCRDDARASIAPTIAIEWQSKLRPFEQPANCFGRDIVSAGDRAMLICQPEGDVRRVFVMDPSGATTDVGSVNAGFDASTCELHAASDRTLLLSCKDPQGFRVGAVSNPDSQGPLRTLSLPSTVGYRVLEGGRVLVASSIDPQGTFVDLSLVDTANVMPLARVNIPGNLVDVEVDASGFIRLGIDATRKFLPEGTAASARYQVTNLGRLIPLP